MNTLELQQILKTHLPQVNTGVYAENELSTQISRPFAMIVNTDPSDKRGTHWTAIYLCVNRTGEFFDSSGREPDVPVRQYVNEFAPNGWQCNTRKVQGHFSTLCGAYCIQYLMTRQQSSASFSSLLYRLFPFRSNDKLVQQRMEEQFGIPLPVYDFSF